MALWTTAFASAAVCGPLGAQTLQGRVVGELDDRPVPGALVELVDTLDARQAVAISDSAGAYVLRAPAPGVYHLRAERIGFEAYRSARIELSRADGVYRADLLMPTVPVPVRGLEVTADRLAAIERSVRLEIGISPRSLRNGLILRPEIESHLRRGRDLDDLLRWSNIGGLMVIPTTDGHCFQARRRACLPVYLNGWRVRPETVDLVPLDLAETIAIVLPGESIQYPGGAVLLYSAAWLR